MLSSHHHGDHVVARQLRGDGRDIIAPRIRENFLRLKRPGAPNIVFEDRGRIQAASRCGYHRAGGPTGDTVIRFRTFAAQSDR
jgi:hypothetical protein